MSTTTMRDDVSQLVQETYSELRRLAERHLRHERNDHTLQPTALVHETWLRLARQDRATWSDRLYFLRVAGETMRRILVNHERDRRRLKRGGAMRRVRLEDCEPWSERDPVDLLALDDALNRLGAIDARKVEVVQMRWFAGLGVEETAAALDISVAQVKRDWALARAWIARALGADDDRGDRA